LLAEQPNLMTRTLNNLQQLLTISDDLIGLAEKIVAESENEEASALYGNMLDSAYKLKKSGAENGRKKWGK